MFLPVLRHIILLLVTCLASLSFQAAAAPTTNAIPKRTTNSAAKTNAPAKVAPAKPVPSTNASVTPKSSTSNAASASKPSTNTVAATPKPSTNSPPAASKVATNALAARPANTIPAAIIPPKVAREFRGAWIATYANIDWPSKPGLPVAQQKVELINLLEKAAQLRLNAILLQVRPACDTFYPSAFEPWSGYFTGVQGQGPTPAWDPLAFAVEQAHARGLELHAWFNPYRAGLVAGRPAAARHVTRTHPKWVRRYDKHYWLDPAEPGVQDHTTRVILDVVRRYDIDGVHLDDYFYPYPQKDRNGLLLDFPDQALWQKYRAAGGKLDRASWRRDNVNKLVERLDREVHRLKPWLLFGISPFGIWRPGFPAQIQGLDAFDKLYADSRQWLVKGWVDYLAPQLYWPIDPPAQSFSVLLNWWERQNDQAIPLWPGGAVHRVGNEWRADEILRQIDLAHTLPSPGYTHYNLSSLLNNADGLADRLARTHYRDPALVPAVVTNAPAAKPFLSTELRNGARNATWNAGTNSVAFWLVQSKVDGRWQTVILPGAKRSMPLAPAKPEALAVAAVNRFRVISPFALLVP